MESFAVGVRVVVRNSDNQLPAEGLDSQGPRLSSPAEWERSAAIVRGTGGQYIVVCSVSNSLLTHSPFTTLSQPFWIKCERYIFSNKLCSLDHYCWLCFRIYVCTNSSTTTIQQCFELFFLPPFVCCFVMFFFLQIMISRLGCVS